MVRVTTSTAALRIQPRGTAPRRGADTSSNTTSAPGLVPDGDRQSAPAALDRLS